MEGKVFGSKMGRVLHPSSLFFFFFLVRCCLDSFPSSCGIAFQDDFSFYIQPVRPSPRNSLGQTVKEILVFDLATGK